MPDLSIIPTTEILFSNYPQLRVLPVVTLGALTQTRRRLVSTRWSSLKLGIQIRLELTLQCSGVTQNTLRNPAHSPPPWAGYRTCSGLVFS